MPHLKDLSQRHAMLSSAHVITDRGPRIPNLVYGEGPPSEPSS